MKSVIKRSLFVGISLALVALTARRFSRESEIEASVDKSAGGEPIEKKGERPRGLPRTMCRNMVPPTVTFSGKLVRNGPRLALRETAGVLYPLDSAGRAWPFEGAQVRVTGKLDLDTRLLYVDAIEPAVL